jgi:hypothetical protein
VLALLLAAALAAPPPLSIATLPLDGAGLPEGMAASATVLVPTEVRRARPDARVISSDDVRSLLTHQKERLVLGCGDDPACLADLGGVLGVDEIVAGRIGRLGSTWVLELRRLDVKQARNIGSVTRAVGSAEALVGAVRSAAGELYAPPPGAAAPASTGGHPDAGTAGRPLLRLPDDPGLPDSSLVKGVLELAPLEYRGSRHRAAYQEARAVIVDGGFQLEKERLEDDAALSFRTEWTSIERGRRLRFRVQVDGRVSLDLERQRCDSTGCRETDTLTRGEQELAAGVSALLRGRLARLQ